CDFLNQRPVSRPVHGHPFDQMWRFADLCQILFNQVQPALSRSRASHFPVHWLRTPEYSIRQTCWVHPGDVTKPDESSLLDDHADWWLVVAPSSDFGVPNAVHDRDIENAAKASHEECFQLVEIRLEQNPRLATIE